MLVYAGEGHGLQQTKNQVDYQRRISFGGCHDGLAGVPTTRLSIP